MYYCQSYAWSSRVSAGINSDRCKLPSKRMAILFIVTLSGVVCFTQSKHVDREVSIWKRFRTEQISIKIRRWYADKKERKEKKKKENGPSANEFTKRRDLLCSELIGTDSRHWLDSDAAELFVPVSVLRSESFVLL